MDWITQASQFPYSAPPFLPRQQKTLFWYWKRTTCRHKRECSGLPAYLGAGDHRYTFRKNNPTYHSLTLSKYNYSPTLLLYAILLSQSFAIALYSPSYLFVSLLLSSHLNTVPYNEVLRINSVDYRKMRWLPQLILSIIPKLYVSSSQADLQQNISGDSRPRDREPPILPPIRCNCSIIFGNDQIENTLLTVNSLTRDKKPLKCSTTNPPHLKIHTRSAKATVALIY